MTASLAIVCGRRDYLKSIYIYITWILFLLFQFHMLFYSPVWTI